MIPNKNHGSLGGNIKVHFAGAEGVDRAFIAHDIGVRYFLFTVLPFIKDRFGISFGHFSYTKSLLPQKELPKMANHVIMDSGLFSLMFGACRDTNVNEKFIYSYLDAICNFVHQNGAYDLTCVECDCQKLLGTDLAWTLRQRMRESIPNKIINVFHFEDGKSGLDRLVEFSDYIAISVPELRIVKPKTFREDTYRLASYIKNKKPEIDIHLLGGTDFKILEQCKFCTSADSTSWLFGNRTTKIFGHKKEFVKKDKLFEYMPLVESYAKRIGVELTEKRANNFLWEYFWADAYFRKFQKYAGSQD